MICDAKRIHTILTDGASADLVRIDLHVLDQLAHPEEGQETVRESLDTD